MNTILEIEESGGPPTYNLTVIKGDSTEAQNRAITLYRNRIASFMLMLSLTEDDDRITEIVENHYMEWRFRAGGENYTLIYSLDRGESSRIKVSIEE
jgi:hypothetical protein